MPGKDKAAGEALIKELLAHCGDDFDLKDIVSKNVYQMCVNGRGALRQADEIKAKIDAIRANLAEIRVAANGNAIIEKAGVNFMIGIIDEKFQLFSVSSDMAGNADFRSFFHHIDTGVSSQFTVDFIKFISRFKSIILQCGIDKYKFTLPVIFCGDHRETILIIRQYFAIQSGKFSGGTLPGGKFLSVESECDSFADFGTVIYFAAEILGKWLQISVISGEDHSRSFTGGFHEQPVFTDFHNFKSGDRRDDENFAFRKFIY